MTFQEACKTGMPFIATNEQGTEEMFQGWYSNKVLYFGVNFTIEVRPVGVILSCAILDRIYTVVDWFEPTMACGIGPDYTPPADSAREEQKAEAKAEIKHRCTCDFYLVILRTGCQCGGE